MRINSWLSRPGLIRHLLSKSRLALRLMREPRVPWLTKLLLVLSAAYLVSPLDLVPDLLPLLGQLDDLTVVIAALELFVRSCPPGAASHHADAIARGDRFSPMSGTDEIIDAEWRRDD